MGILSRLLSKPEAKEIVGEIARAIRKKEDGTLFANAFLEMLRDPRDGGLRRDANMLLTFASTRDWNEMLFELKRTTDKETFKILKSPGASMFFEAWKSMVKAEVAAYWNGLAKANQKGKKRTG